MADSNKIPESVDLSPELQKLKEFLQISVEEQKRFAEKSRGFWSIFDKKAPREGAFQALFKKFLDVKEYKKTYKILEDKLKSQLGNAPFTKEHQKLLHQETASLISNGKGLSSFATFLRLGTKALNGFMWAISAVTAVLQTFGEKGKYYKSFGQMTGLDPLSNLNKLSMGSLGIASRLNKPFVNGKFNAFANNEEFKGAFRSLFEAGVFSTKNIPELTDVRSIKSYSENLVSSFIDLAAAGKMLGLSFEETARNITQVSSIYNLGQTALDSLENFKAFNSILSAFRSKGFNDSNFFGFITSYNRMAAQSSFGKLALGPLNDIVALLKLIESNDKLAEIPPQMMANMVSTIVSSTLSIGQFAGLVDRKQRYSIKDMDQLTYNYYNTSRLAQIGAIGNMLASKTKLGNLALTSLAAQYFPGLQSEQGALLIRALRSKEAQEMLKTDRYRKMNPAEQLKTLLSENDFAGINAENMKDLRQYAYTQQFLEKPLDTIIAILTGLLKSVVQIAGTVAIFSKPKSTTEILNEAVTEFKGVGSNARATAYNI